MAAGLDSPDQEMHPPLLSAPFLLALSPPQAWTLLPLPCHPLPEPFLCSSMGVGGLGEQLPDRAGRAGSQPMQDRNLEQEGQHSFP